MIHKVLEELFDTLLFLTGVLGMLLFFFLYWNCSFQIRYAEDILQEFLGKVAVTGTVTKEDFQILQKNLYEIVPTYELDIKCFRYQEQPVYALVSQENMHSYFQSENRIKLHDFEEYQLPVLQELQEPEKLQLQTETNASVLAAEKQEYYLPLPVENMKMEITPLRPQQEVYEGEKLITVCRVSDSNTCYYAEAMETFAKKSGETELSVEVNGELYHVPVQVICHPRTIQCDEGHTLINDRQMLEEKKQTGSVSCPYCRILPRQISCVVSEIRFKTGEELTEKNIGIKVTYMDGSSGFITPESTEWQDNYDKEFCGTQLVTIRYRNAETNLAVITENDPCRQCGKACNDRCKNAYLEYPYCLECLADMYIFTGQIRLEERITEGTEFLALLDTEQELIFSRGDFVMLELEIGRDRTLCQKQVTIDGNKRSRE